MTITIRLKTDNAAFEDDQDAEIARILAEYLLTVGRFGFDSRKLRDINGNIVGTVKVTGR